MDFRVAVIILHKGYYFTNIHRLLGKGQTKIRHLQKLGYKVVQVSLF